MTLAREVPSPRPACLGLGPGHAVTPGGPPRPALRPLTPSGLGSHSHAAAQWGPGQRAVRAHHHRRLRRPGEWPRVSRGRPGLAVVGTSCSPDSDRLYE